MAHGSSNDVVRRRVGEIIIVVVTCTLHGGERHEARSWACPWAGASRQKLLGGNSAHGQPPARGRLLGFR